jgi:ribosomal protein S18 acetylase RimI-like enzyme
VDEALAGRGYAPVRYFFEMIRPALDGIPPLELPAGIDVRPVEPGQLRAIWQAEIEAFEGHWGASEEDASETRWDEWRGDPLNDLALWQVAWQGDEVVGMVRPFINALEIDRLGVRRGWCENISVRAPWRGRGVASALMSLALHALRERGMTESALSVDADNETGALGLYRRMGFREVARESHWRRPLGPEVGR